MLAVQKPIAITIGDVAGIGPEIIVKAFLQSPEQFNHCIVVGDKAVMQRAWQVVTNQSISAQAGLTVQQVGNPLSPAQLPSFGEISAVAGQLAADSITWAAQSA